MKRTAFLLAALLTASVQAAGFSNKDLATGYFMDDATPLSNQEQAGVQAASKARNMQSVKPVATPDGVVRFPFGASRPVVVCAVLQVCDIELQPGEVITDLKVGDPRFELTPSISGPEGNQTMHVVVKPFDVGLKTSLIIPTDRRVYHIELRSHLEQYMSRVGFFYPDDQKKLIAVAKRQEAAERKRQEMPNTGEYLGDLDFNYRIEGDAPWRPIRVYNDGQKTIIQMPADVGRTEAPIFSVLRGGGWFSDPEKVVVNYRLQGDRYIVDAIFDRGVLFAGVGGDERSVEIRRGK